MHVPQFLDEARTIALMLSVREIELLVDELVRLRTLGGRLFIAGLGGSAANASHATNDFRKLCGIETYCLTDNVSELTARANDDGWNHMFSPEFWRKTDALMIMSVGGGTLNTSFPLCLAIDEAKKKKMCIMGIVGRDGGYTKKYGDAVVVIPTVNEKHVTPHTEAFQMVVLHLLVSHPDLQQRKTKW